MQANKRCWHCAQAHAAQCTLKKPYNVCQGTHLLALHGLNTRTGESRIDVTAKEESCLTNSYSESFYLDQPDAGNCVLLKAVSVLIHYGVRQDIQVLQGHTVSFHVSPVANPQTSYEIKGTFTVGRLSLAYYTYHIESVRLCPPCGPAAVCTQLE
ncbi:hypothetical protein AOLI_G00017660 [Acnodon oligacanthus]